MKIWKLVMGILSIVIAAISLIQSFAILVFFPTESFVGIIVAAMLLSGGIVAIVGRNKPTIGNDVALLILSAIAVLFGFVLSGEFTDLKIYAFWAAICFITAIICIYQKKKK